MGSPLDPRPPESTPGPKALPKFIQILFHGVGSGRLLALDESGDIWVQEFRANAWDGVNTNTGWYAWVKDTTMREVG